MKQIGRNGRLYVGTIGAVIKNPTEIKSNNANDEKVFLVKGLGSPTSLPVKEKYFFILKNNKKITLKAGDEVYPITLDAYCPATQWGFEPTMDTIDVTSQCDDGFKKAIPSGWSNAEGTLTAFFDDENTFQEDLIKQFFYSVNVGVDGTLTASDPTGVKTAILRMYDDVVTEGRTKTVSYLMAININKISLTTDIMAERKFETPFSLSPLANPTRIVEAG